MSDVYSINFWGTTTLVLPRGYVLLLVSPPNAGKTNYSLRFALDGIKQGEEAVFISLNNTVEEVLKHASESGFREDELKELKIIDYFLTHMNRPELPYTLYDLSKEMSNMMDDARSSKTRFVIDSLCTLDRKQTSRRELKEARVHWL